MRLLNVGHVARCQLRQHVTPEQSEVHLYTVHQGTHSLLPSPVPSLVLTLEMVWSLGCLVS